MGTRELGRNERDASVGYWADGKFVKWVDTQREVDAAFNKWCLKEPELRGHLLPKSVIAGLPPEVQNRITKKAR